MYNNYFFLRQLTLQLNKDLAGYTLVSCFSQSKDELVIELNNASRSFFIKASLLPTFSCLYFPAQFSRARKNSIDLFLPLLLKKVESVFVFENERSLGIQLEDDHQLIFKMHGARANVLYAYQNQVKEIFRNHLKADLEIIPTLLHRPIDWSRACFDQHRGDIFKVYFTLGREVQRYLHTRHFSELPRDEQWTLMQETLALLNQPVFYIAEENDQLSFSLLPTGTIKYQYQNPVEAINQFFLLFAQHEAFTRERNNTLRQLQEKIKSTERYIADNTRKLEELRNDKHWQQWADLLMAHLHLVKPGSRDITVADFFNHNEPTTIPLKKDLNAQQNAEVFYRKNKNLQIERSKIEEALDKKRTLLKVLREQLEQAQQIETPQVWRREMATMPKPKKENQERSLPYHEFVYKGFRIWVGRDAQSNDELTLKLSHKEDLWLHAKDVAGSHVIIKHQSGKKFPKDVIERAAALAAYNSKRRTETLCPVAFTPKKFVRKRKGDPPGAVVVDREEVILVEPKL